MLVAVLSALAAGGCFAAAGVLQQRVAATRPQDEALSVRLLVDLIRHPLWLGGIGVAVLSYAFQALALAFGPLAVVQPLIITELVFAIPVTAYMQHTRLGAREWSAVLGVALGLALAIVAADPRGGHPLPSFVSWLTVLPAVAALSIIVVIGGNRLHDTFRASAFAFAAACVLGTQAALLQSTTVVFRGGILHGLSSWQPYMMAAFAIGGLLLVQSAYQAGPLAASLPVIDAVEPAIAVVIGVTIFDEHVRSTPLAIALAVLGIAVLITGILTLDSSPRVRKIYEVQIARLGPGTESNKWPAGPGSGCGEYAHEPVTASKRASSTGSAAAVGPARSADPDVDPDPRNVRTG